MKPTTLKLFKYLFYFALAGLLATAALFYTRDAQALEKILRPWMTARTAAMGGVLYSTGLYDQNFLANPARMSANPEGRVQIFDFFIGTNFDTLSQVSTLMSSDGGDGVSSFADAAGENMHGRFQVIFPAVYWNAGKMSYAIGLLHSVQTDAKVRNSYRVDSLFVWDSELVITASRKFLPDDALAVGLNLRGGYRASTDSAESFSALMKGSSVSPLTKGTDGAQIDFDLGSTYRLPVHPWEMNIDTAFAINNILGGRYANLGSQILIKCDNATGCPMAEQPRTLNFGVAAVKPALWKFTDLTAALELINLGNNDGGSLFRLLHLGFEAKWKSLSPRLGFFQGYFTAGLGMDFKAVRLDLATYGEELSLNAGGVQDRLWVGQLTFGF